MTGLQDREHGLYRLRTRRQYRVQRHRHPLHLPYARFLLQPSVARLRPHSATWGPLRCRCRMRQRVVQHCWPLHTLRRPAAHRPSMGLRSLHLRTSRHPRWDHHRSLLPPLARATRTTSSTSPSCRRARALPRRHRGARCRRSRSIIHGSDAQQPQRKQRGRIPRQRLFSRHLLHLRSEWAFSQEWRWRWVGAAS